VDLYLKLEIDNEIFPIRRTESRYIDFIEVINFAMTINNPMSKRKDGMRYARFADDTFGPNSNSSAGGPLAALSNRLNSTKASPALIAFAGSALCLFVGLYLAAPSWECHGQCFENAAEKRDSFSSCLTECEAKQSTAEKLKS
jgi:hypothetical protein